LFPPFAIAPDPGDVSVGPEHGRRRSHLVDGRELPDAEVAGINELNAFGPWCDVEPTGLIEVEPDTLAS
jgi:hypothetical protein